MNPALRPVIVGAGPAGIRAAETLVAHGLRPVVIDEGNQVGGQIYRQQPASFGRAKADLYGFETDRAIAVHGAMENVLGDVDYRPRTLVWNAEGGSLDLLQDGKASTLAYSHLIIATGATDRVLPFPGWTLPGVYTLGGAQVALKFQGCAIGSRVVFVGTGPLLYLVAYQYAKSGAEVAAVLDTARLSGKIRAAPGMLRQPALLAKGLYYLGRLRAHGVTVRSGVLPVRALGDGRVSGFVWREGARECAASCDAIGFGYALRSETQLADLLGCRFAFDSLNRAFLPEKDPAGRSSVAGIYLAGDGAGIMGADAAELAGMRAAMALLQDVGVATDAARAADIERKLMKIAGFRRALEGAFPFPDDWAANAQDDLIICRCEEIRVGALREAARTLGAVEMNRLKALTRIGMGRCQGRICGPAAAEILAQARSVDVAAVGRLRSQPPVKPIPFGVAEAAREAAE
jgi:NADPH-dependent 2,4-dienoyl-CoA reductase/sulfur reductase-like enzyme